ncbi:MAG: hypothetical protein DLM60_10520 [Pseudonocardiales bacterium]|nr:MAG: hypothetical protein DLM60_10520 [Pseudonocardiales bacterium]
MFILKAEDHLDSYALRIESGPHSSARSLSICRPHRNASLEGRVVIDRSDLHPMRTCGYSAER